ncbi:MAG TPA: HD-GYP domain-containing protein [Acidobacteriaceae bacterium]|nr:HD-GYP domain-containing protein [Acidobacteriaceae bacterium]
MPHDSVFAIGLLASLAIVAELLSYLLPNSARGSIAFIPYLAMAVVVPGWEAVIAIVVVRALIETVRRSALRVATFNIAQHALTLSLAIWVYTTLGGVGMLGAPRVSFIQATALYGIQALAAFAASFLTNGITACAYLALQKGQTMIQLWRQMVLPSLALDLVAGPMVFIFAWLYATHGAIAASALWVPLLGLREVHRVNLELQRTNEELLQLMIKSIEARDLYTSGHSRRVQHFSMIIARSLGFSQRDVERVGKAALLHDVGKIYDKYAPILRKPDKLTPDEWATIQEHPIDGANLVATISGLKDVVPAIRHHHENWDGTGYPDGLAGEAIPLPARIISFADTIDAMTSERPYRRPMTQEHVRAEIVRCRGKQFDPGIADRLLGSPMWSLLFTPASHSTTPRRSLAVVRTKSVRESA